MEEPYKKGEAQMRWLSKLFGRKAVEIPTRTTDKSKEPAVYATPQATVQVPPSPQRVQAQQEVAPDPSDTKRVSDALSRFFEETEDGPRVEQLRIIKEMGRRSLHALLHEAFDEYGDPTTEDIDIYRIRVAVWCGCALHPDEFDRYYRTKYQKGRTRMLDEMRALNMKEGMHGQTYIHELFARDTNKR
jgi:hypothetical protein